MENKVIAKEYVDKNYIHKNLIRLAWKEIEDMSISEDIYFEDIEKIFKGLLEDK